jgi:hypothetical protein
MHNDFGYAIMSGVGGHIRRWDTHLYFTLSWRKEHCNDQIDVNIPANGL